MPAGFGKVLPGLVVAGVVAVGWFVLRPGSADGRATAADVLREGVAALSDLRSVYLRANVRTLPGGGFDTVGPEYEFLPIEMWKEFGETPKWRVEKAGRVAVMDGRSSLLLIQADPRGRSGTAEEGGSRANFAGFLESLVDVDQVLDSEGRLARRARRTLSLDQEWGGNGARKWVVTSRCAVIPQTALASEKGAESSDWLTVDSVSGSENRRVYRFDAQTHLLENVKVYVNTGPTEVLVIEAVEIVYEPAIAPETFALALPKNVNWVLKPSSPSGDGRVAVRSPREAAQAFFIACAREKWDEALEFWPESSFDDRFKSVVGGVRIVRLGEALRSGLYAGWFVPYEIQLRSGETSKGKLAMLRDKPANRWVVDGGL